MIHRNAAYPDQKVFSRYHSFLFATLRAALNDFSQSTGALEPTLAVHVRSQQFEAAVPDPCHA